MAFPFSMLNIAYPAAGFKSKTHVYCNAKNDYFPANVSGPEKLLELLKSRGIFVDLLSDREVCTFNVREYCGTV